MYPMEIVIPKKLEILSLEYQRALREIPPPLTDQELEDWKAHLNFFRDKKLANELSRILALQRGNKNEEAEARNL